jgi:hypothetical protein
MREHAWLLPLIVVVVIARPSRTWGRTNAVSHHGPVHPAFPVRCPIAPPGPMADMTPRFWTVPPRRRARNRTASADTPNRSPAWA